MNFAEHIQLGKDFLEKKDSASMKNAMLHFKKANELTNGRDMAMAKPQTLYYLALGNYWIGNINLSYRIAIKAKKSIDVAMKNSTILFDDMRNNLGEKRINDLMENLKIQFPKVTNSISTNDLDFNENELDFSLIDKIYSEPISNNSEKSHSHNSLSKQLENANELDNYIINTFTENQKRSVLFSLNLLAQSDGELHKNEIFFLLQTADLLGIDLYSNKFIEFQSLGIFNLFEVLNTFDLKQKDWFIITVFTMANADFKIVSKEHEYMKLFFEKMDITNESIDKCINNLG